MFFILSHAGYLLGYILGGSTRKLFCTDQLLHMILCSGQWFILFCRGIYEWKPVMQRIELWINIFFINLMQCNVMIFTNKGSLIYQEKRVCARTYAKPRIIMKWSRVRGIITRAGARNLVGIHYFAVHKVGWGPRPSIDPSTASTVALSTHNYWAKALQLLQVMPCISFLVWRFGTFCRDSLKYHAYDTPLHHQFCCIEPQLYIRKQRWCVGENKVWWVC
jgi:hypothetical protein